MLNIYFNVSGQTFHIGLFLLANLRPFHTNSCWFELHMSPHRMRSWIYSTAEAVLV